MMFVGGLQIIRSGVLIASLPLLVVGVAMMVSLSRSLRQGVSAFDTEPALEAETQPAVSDSNQSTNSPASTAAGDSSATSA